MGRPTSRRARTWSRSGPFSDPLADGPTIQDTTTLAIENGADLNYCLDLASTFSDRVPVVFLLYYNVIFARGIEEFVREAAAAGVRGSSFPTCPWTRQASSRGSSEAGVAFCPLVAPTSTDERLARVGELASGFVYCVSVAGVTGVRDALPSGAVELLRRARAKTDAPVALGFGIGSPEAAVEAAGEADGVIIGSKLMRLVGEGGPERAGSWLREVREALSGVVRSGGAIRNWLSKRREYTRSAPETESWIGPLDDTGFTKCERCGQPIYEKDLLARFNVCPHCEFHYPLPAPERIRLLTDAGSFEERDRGMAAGILWGSRATRRGSRTRERTRVSPTPC